MAREVHKMINVTGVEAALLAGIDALRALADDYPSNSEDGGPDPNCPFDEGGAGYEAIETMKKALRNLALTESGGTSPANPV